MKTSTKLKNNPGGVAQWASLLPQEQETNKAESRRTDRSSFQIKAIIATRSFTSEAIPRRE
jgi:hypothetical protein